MNVATARGILGADVAEKGECQFVSQDGRELRIEIGGDFRALVKQCGSVTSALKGIGNEAVACTVGREARVVSRIREKAFVVSVSPANRDEAETAAEIVAGNLY